MNENLQKQIEQSVYYQLKQFCRIITPVQECPYYRFIASSTDETQRFGIDVLANDEKDLCDRKTRKIRENIQQDAQLSIPIIACFVDTKTFDVSLQIVLNRRYEHVQIIPYNIEKACSMTEKSMALILHNIDTTIRCLPKPMWSVCKSLILNDEKFPNASIIYLRSLRENYKMKQSLQTEDLERFNRLLQGIPEEEYPSDEVDNLLFSLSRDHFKNVKVRSSLVLFNTDLKNLQIYKNLYKHAINVMFLNYDLEYQAMNGGTILSKRLELFTQRPTYEINLMWQTYHTEEEIQNLDKLMNDTYSPLSKYLI